MKLLAKIISFVFHPLMMATYLFAVLSWALPTALYPVKQESHNLFLFFIWMITFGLPVGVMSFFRMFGTIQSYTMVDRKERVLPFILIFAVYATITFLFYFRIQFSFDDNFMRLMLIIDALVFAAVIATFFFKVSVHSIAMWGMIGILIPLNKITEINTLFYPALATILITGIVMSSRLYLQVHTSREVMWGGVIGLATSVAGMLILFH